MASAAKKSKTSDDPDDPDDPDDSGRVDRLNNLDEDAKGHIVNFLTHPKLNSLRVTSKSSQSEKFTSAITKIKVPNRSFRDLAWSAKRSAVCDRWIQIRPPGAHTRQEWLEERHLLVDRRL